MSRAASLFVPPRKVENSSAEPVEFSSVIVASPTPLNVESGASAVTGKSAELVPPVSQALPVGSRTIALNESLSEPPTNVEYTNAEPAALNLVTNASPLLKVLSYAPGGRREVRR